MLFLYNYYCSYLIYCGPPLLKLMHKCSGAVESGVGEQLEMGLLEVQVRTFNLLETKSMRDLGPGDLDKLVAIKGMLTRSGVVIPDIKEGKSPIWLPVLYVSQRHCHLCSQYVQVFFAALCAQTPLLCRLTVARSTSHLFAQTATLTKVCSWYIIVASLQTSRSISCRKPLV